MSAMSTNATNAGTDPCVLSIIIRPLYFPAVCSFLDWTEFSTVAPAVAAPAAVLPPPPGAGGPLTLQALATQVSTLVTTLNAHPSGGGGGHPGGNTPDTRRQLMYTFNVNGLPSDVKKHYENKVKGGMVTLEMVDCAYDHGSRYFLDNERLFLKDGSLFLLETTDPDEKAFLRNPINCKSLSPSGIRQWYHAFVEHCMDHGYFALPFSCFRKNHGGPWGFTCGDQGEHDLPKRMALPTQHMSRSIYHLLQSKYMFPSDGMADILRQCYNDGYKALKHILYIHHPAFHVQPATMVTHYPTQRTLSLTEYHSEFVDFLQQRALILNTKSTLDSPDELDILIIGAKHSTWLNGVTLEERQHSHLLHKYTADQIVETLSTWLRSPSSPEIAAARAPPARAPRGRSVNPVDTFTNMDDSWDNVLAELPNIQVPDDHYSRQLHALYVGAISTSPSTQDNQHPSNCIVCNGPHRFDTCPVLADAEFLRGHYIRYCQHLRRDAASRSAAFSGTAGSVPGVAPSRVTRPVSLLDIYDAAAPLADVPVDDPDALDFQPGHQ